MEVQKIFARNIKYLEKLRKYSFFNFNSSLNSLLYSFSFVLLSHTFSNILICNAILRLFRRHPKIYMFMLQNQNIQ